MPRILIIEDTQSVREEISALLRFEGFEVVEAESGLAGVSQALDAKPDLVICDILMPSMDGHQVLRQLRESETTSLVPFIFLTAKSSRGDVRAGMNLGADDYITKPFTAVELLEAVRTRLNRRTSVDSHISAQLHTVRQQLDTATHFDMLTGLPNRLKLRDDIQAVLSANSGQETLTLIVVDIDRFHLFNNALGPDYGDELIKIIATRVKAALPPEATLFRQVGDRFNVTLLSAFSPAEAAAVATELLSAIRPPVRFKNQDLRVTASAGIARYPNDAETLDDLLQNAEMAMMQAKRSGVDSVRHFDPALRNEAMDRIRLTSDLFDALNRQELFLNFQPLMDIATRRCAGLEALLRWRHPTYGPVSPAIFIPLAEESGMIVPIGEWVMREALRFIKWIHEQGWDDLAISVNVSGRQFNDTTFLDNMRRALEASGVPPSLAHLELTENLLMSEAEENVRAIERLKSLGFSLAIDDFGTGYSSLAYLKRFKIDSLKIDRSFVRDLTPHSSDASIVEGILRIAESLGLSVTAEGVETREQLDFLAELKCPCAQGFYFSRPVSGAEIPAFLQRVQS